MEADMSKIIFAIEDCYFRCLSDLNISGDNVEASFADKYYGDVIFFEVEMENNEKALIPFGIKSGEKSGRIVFSIEKHDKNIDIIKLKEAFGYD